MFANFTGWHALIVLAVVVLIFGAAKLPALARSVGQSVRILKDEAAEVQRKPDDVPVVTVSAAVVPPAADGGTDSSAGSSAAARAARE